MIINHFKIFDRDRGLMAGAVVLATTGAGYLFWRLRWRLRSESHTFFSSLNHYVNVNALRLIGSYMRGRLDMDTTRCQQVQEEFLMFHIRKNSETEYGRDHRFAEINSREDFVRLHPLTRHSDFESYIERVANGEEHILTRETPYILGVTSGTSGENKLLPTIRLLLRIFFAYGISIMIHTMIQHYPETSNPQRGLRFAYTPKWRHSPAGILVGPSSYMPKQPASILNLYTTPPPAMEILSEPEALYVHLLFGLKDRNVGSLEANFAPMIYTPFQALHSNWQRLVEDIKAGVIGPNLNIDEDIRVKLNRCMKPDPKRAAELRNEFLKGFEGIAKRIWPHLNLVLTVDSGSFQLYGNLLRQSECKGVPFYAPFYAASEGLLGVNIDPLAEERQYLLVPRAMFFEFIPVDNCEEDQPRTLFLDQVQEGGVYELAITNISGLCRYRFGDVIKVTGFHNQCPKVNFMYRQGQFLNVRGEKTSEYLFYKALTEVARDWQGVELHDYCCVESALLQQSSEVKQSHGTALYYGLFLELDEGQKLTTQQMSQIDESLCKQTYVYDSFRKKQSIGAMQVHQVEPGTFRDLKLFTVANTDASLNQFKVPRVMRRPEGVSFLVNRISK